RGCHDRAQLGRRGADDGSGPGGLGPRVGDDGRPVRSAWRAVSADRRPGRRGARATGRGAAFRCRCLRVDRGRQRGSRPLVGSKVSMSFSLIPPEINSALMYSGAGSGPLLEAATAWDELAADLEATATQYQTAVTNLTTETWLGPSSAHMASAAEPYIAWLQATATEAAQTGAQAKAAAAAYQTAYASMVPPPLIAANRAELATLVSNNFLGQNTGAIAQNEAEYLDMWIQDALGMDTYQQSSTGASAALPAQTAAPLVTSGTQAAPAAASAASGLDPIVLGALNAIAELFGAPATGGT